MKLLLEKRSKLIEQIESIMEGAEKETRAFSNDELTKVNELKESINQTDKTIKAKEEARDLMNTIKKALGEAMVIGTVSNIAKTSRSKVA